MTEVEMATGLAKVKEANRGEAKGKQIECLKAQMKYREKILEQAKIDAKDWRFSEDGQPPDVATLSIKLSKLIAQTASHI